MSGDPVFVEPDWPAPSKVRAAVTTRWGGISRGPFASLNLGAHVGDVEAAVAENRRRVRSGLALPAEPAWLDQVHGVAVRELGTAAPAAPADAAVAFAPGQVCTILTADCLPVLFCDRAGSCTGAAHAGWRGLAAGVLEATVAALARPPAELIAWLGPAIGPDHFEVGLEVRTAFVRSDPAAAGAFRANAVGRWQADLYRLARQRLARAGVTAVHGGGSCTYAQPELFYSHRRDGACGRQACLVWRV